jgi:BASS family bile acid:Na+ symporter
MARSAGNDEAQNMNKTNLLKVLWSLVAAMAIFYTGSCLMGTIAQGGPFLIAFFGLTALAFRGYERLKGFSYTFLIFASVAASMYYPQYFIAYGDFKLSGLIVPLLQLIMFGMGTALSWQDFASVVKMPKGVGIGVVCQFTIMPLVGFSLTKLFGFPAEIAAGIILVGSCPSGLASNVMSFLARANLALSVTLTAFATLLAPLMTPFLMQTLAGEYVPVEFGKMMLDIIKMVILPIIGGLLFHHFLLEKFRWLEKVMPLVSMGGIALIIVIITAAGRDNLLEIGALLMLATLLHNLTGYFLGYWSARLLGLPESDCRTVSLEVGLQNGGLASGLALQMGKLATVGLAPAIFGPLMNITGSSLATWWRDKPVPETDTR